MKPIIEKMQSQRTVLKSEKYKNKITVLEDFKKLSIQDPTFKYNEKSILSGFNLEIERGKNMLWLGRLGAGNQLLLILFLKI